MSPYILQSVEGSKVVPTGKSYTIYKAVVGESAVFLPNGEDGLYRTSPLKQVSIIGDEIVLSTQNSIYTFKKEEIK